MHQTVLKDGISMIVSGMAGFGLWAASPVLTDTPSPWDAAWPFYSITLLLVGVANALFTDHPWLGVVATWLGQVWALIILPLDRTVNMWGITAWWVIGIVATGIGSLLVLLGWFMGRALRRRT